MLTLALFLAMGPGPHAGDWPAPNARCRPVPLTSVRPAGFLGRRIAANSGSLLAGVKSPIPRGFEARAAGREPPPETNRLAADSDLYKWIEGASYMVALTRNAELEAELERIARLVLACQKEDGYINTQVPPNRRFDPRINHDLYTAGHFFEAAVAHHRATGSRRLLDAAQRWADYLIREYKAGNPYFQNVGRDHSEYELGLLRLFRATGDRRYADFSIALTRMVPAGPYLILNRHAVRTNYLLAAYADLSLETGEASFRKLLEPLWKEIVETRSFVTGGVSIAERYGEPYNLPQWLPEHKSRDIAETCAAVSLMMFGWRLHGLTADSRYFDRIERILYNHYLGAVSLDHLGTFYYNPIRMLGGVEGKTDHGGPLSRRTMLPAIHSTACCITNEWRFFGALAEYLFSYDESGVFVNLYTSGTVRLRLPSGVEAAFEVATHYPRDGRVTVRALNDAPQRYAIRFRIPEWSRAAALYVPGEARRAAAPGRYETVERVWRRGDRVTLVLDMPVRLLRPDPREKDNAGHAALARGPLVFCLEQQDAGFPIEEAAFAFSPEETPTVVKPRWRPELLGGVHTLEAPGFAGKRSQKLVLVPFYSRANRAGDNRWLTYLTVAPRKGANWAGRKGPALRLRDGQRRP